MKRSRITLSPVLPACSPVTAAGYHAWKKRPAPRRIAEDERLKKLVQAAHEGSHGIYGAPRIHAELALARGEHVSRKRVARLMVELGLEGVSRRGKRRARSAEAETPAAPDLVRRQFTADAPNQLWIAVSVGFSRGSA